MLNVLIVTDSAASFPDRAVLSSTNLYVIPNRFRLDGNEQPEDFNLSSRDLWERMRASPAAVTIEPPSPLDYYQLFQSASARYDGILSIHPSSKISPSYLHAQVAADRISGRCLFAQIDSQGICASQGLLVNEAIRRLETAASFDDLVREVRNQTSRLFSIYYVESTEALLHNGIISSEHSVLTAMLGMKPLLTLDNGKIVTTGKARSRNQVIEQLMEFAEGFDDFDAAVVVQPEIAQRSDITRTLVNRLSDNFPSHTFSVTGYSPALASILGTHAGGLVILGSRIGEEHGIYED